MSDEFDFRNGNSGNDVRTCKGSVRAALQGQGQSYWNSRDSGQKDKLTSVPLSTPLNSPQDGGPHGAGTIKVPLKL